MISEIKLAFFAFFEWTLKSNMQKMAYWCSLYYTEFQQNLMKMFHVFFLFRWYNNTAWKTLMVNLIKFCKVTIQLNLAVRHLPTAGILQSSEPIIWFTYYDVFVFFHINSVFPNVSHVFRYFFFIKCYLWI